MYRSSADDWQLAKALVEYETLSLDEVKKVLGGQKLERLEALKALGDEVLLGEEERKGQGEIVEGI
jgi:ATP-dependent metalloprotease